MGERTTRALAVVAAAALVGPAGCGDDPAPSAAQVVDAFATPGQEAVAVYLRLDNPGGGDEIVGATVVGSRRALRVTLHQTRERDGLSTMVPVEAIEVDGGGPSTLGPGDAHLMVEELEDPLAVGDRLELRVDFERSEDQEVEVVVIDQDEALDRILADEPEAGS